MRKLRLLSPRACLSDDRGTGVIELAVILPLIAVFLINIIDVSGMVVRRITMQKAVNSSLELVMAKALPTDPETQEPTLDELHAEAARIAGVAPSYVTTDKWLECDGVEQPEFMGECADDEVIARYVQVRVSDWYLPMFSASAVGLSGDQFAIHAEGALRIQ